MFSSRWQQLADLIIDDLCKKPTALLPGIQPLSKKYDASRPTIERALAHLESIDLIHPAQPGKRRSVNHDTLKKITRHRRKKSKLYLFLGTEPDHNLQFSSELALNTARELAEKSDTQIDYLCIPEQPELLRQAISSISPQGIIAYVIPENFVKILPYANTPVVGIGISHTAVPSIPTFNASHSETLLAAFQQAWKSGHTRVTSPLWNKTTQRQETISAYLAEHTPAHIPAFSPNYHLPLLSGKTPADFHKALAPLFLHTPPTCLILGNFSQLLMTLTFLNLIKLNIPKDVSIIVISPDKNLPFIHPPIAHFTSNIASIMSKVLSLLETPQTYEKGKNIFPVELCWNPEKSIKNLN